MRPKHSTIGQLLSILLSSRVKATRLIKTPNIIPQSKQPSITELQHKMIKLSSWSDLFGTKKEKLTQRSTMADLVCLKRSVYKGPSPFTSRINLRPTYPSLHLMQHNRTFPCSHGEYVLRQNPFKNYGGMVYGVRFFSWLHGKDLASRHWKNLMI